MNRAGMAEFCARFGVAPPEDCVQKGTRAFHDPHRLSADVAAWQPFSVGILFGEGQAFSPTSALIAHIGAQTAQRVVVDEDAAWLVICGKDVLMEGVVDPGEFAPGTAVVIQDAAGNTLGWGDIKYAYNPRAKHAMYVKRRLDIGEYLRRER